MAQKWDSFLQTADEWIVNYSLPIMNLTAVKLFSVGHAFELYLKAANTKITGDIDRAIGFGHDLPRVWEDCKNQDPSFLPMYELRKSVLARDLLNQEDYSKLGKDDVMHFLMHQEIYIVAKYLADLKYLGAPLKKVKGAFTIVFIFPNPIWAELFRELRSYLGHPESEIHDTIKQHVEEGQLPPFSVQFLSEVLCKIRKGE